MANTEKYSKEIQDTIVDYIRAGNYMETAAAAAGISKDTLYNWLRRGARYKAGEEDYNIEKYQKYAEFKDKVEQAQAEAEIRDVMIISKAAQESWQAAAWRLERKFPDKWGKKEKSNVELTGKDGGPVELEGGKEQAIIQQLVTDPDIAERVKESYRQAVNEGTSENRL